MDVLGLTDKANTAFRKLSGGQKQRLSIALALLGSPRVAVLDELTTGLDPQARRDTWELIEGVRGRGVTIVLVTHFMEEAERLCDRVALIDAGRVVAVDTPAALAEQVQVGQRIQFRPSAPFDDELLTSLPDVSEVIRTGRCRHGHRQQQRAGRGRVRAGPQPDRARAAARGAGQPRGRVRQADRQARPRRSRQDRRDMSVTMSAADRRQLPAAAASGAAMGGSSSPS